jgi:hypothetical protein
METTRVKIWELIDPKAFPLHDAGMAESMGDPLRAVPAPLSLDDDG